MAQPVVHAATIAEASHAEPVPLSPRTQLRLRAQAWSGLHRASPLLQRLPHPLPLTEVAADQRCARRLLQRAKGRGGEDVFQAAFRRGRSSTQRQRLRNALVIASYGQLVPDAVLPPAPAHARTHATAAPARSRPASAARCRTASLGHGAGTVAVPGGLPAALSVPVLASKAEACRHTHGRTAVMLMGGVSTVAPCIDEQLDLVSVTPPPPPPPLRPLIRGEALEAPPLVTARTPAPAARPAAAATARMRPASAATSRAAALLDRALEDARAPTPSVTALQRPRTRDQAAAARARPIELLEAAGRRGVQELRPLRSARMRVTAGYVARSPA